MPLTAPVSGSSSACDSTALSGMSTLLVASPSAPMHASQAENNGQRTFNLNVSLCICLRCRSPCVPLVCVSAACNSMACIQDRTSVLQGNTSDSQMPWHLLSAGDSSTACWCWGLLPGSASQHIFARYCALSAALRKQLPRHWCKRVASCRVGAILMGRCHR